MNGVLKRMTGAELFLLAAFGDTSVRHEVDGELDRRARTSRMERDSVRDFWAGRIFAGRRSAALAA